MRKLRFRNGTLSLMLCVAMLFSGTTIYADVQSVTETEMENVIPETTEESASDVGDMAVLEESSEIITSDFNDTIDTEQGTEVDEPEEITTGETASVADITVLGLEGVQISEVTDITLSNARSSCGFNHTWKLLNVINEGSCTEQAVFKVQCTVCGATGTVYTDAHGHNYVSGVCSVCGERQGVEVAPDAEIAKWEYELNDIDKTITLKKYISDETEIIIYGSYQVNGVVYRTIIDGPSSNNPSIRPFYDKREIITSIVIQNGVSSINCGGMFFNCVNLTNLDVSGLDTSEATNMSSMFQGCENLAELNLSNLDTSKVTNMFQMFVSCRKLKELDLSSFNTSRVQQMNAMFQGCESLTKLDISSFNTENVYYMNCMFKGCRNLTELNVSNFNTANVFYMDEMFCNCPLLTNLDVSSFNTSKVTRMNGMFAANKNLSSLDLRNFDTSNVTDMSRMFYECSGLTNLDLSNFNTSKVTNMSYMFYECSGFVNFNLSNFNTSNVTNMSYMFTRCNKLTSLDLSSFHTVIVEDMSFMFYGCNNLNSIYVSRQNWNSSFADTTNMFTYCAVSRVTPK